MHNDFHGFQSYWMAMLCSILSWFNRSTSRFNKRAFYLPVYLLYCYILIRHNTQSHNVSTTGSLDTMSDCRNRWCNSYDSMKWLLPVLCILSHIFLHHLGMFWGNRLNSYQSCLHWSIRNTSTWLGALLWCNKLKNIQKNLKLFVIVFW